MTRPLPLAHNRGHFDRIDNFKFAVNRRAVRLDGLLSHFEHLCDFFDRKTLGHQAGHLGFGRRQTLHEHAHFLLFEILRADRAEVLDRLFHLLDELFGLGRFDEKIKRSVVQGLHGHLDVAVTREKNHQQQHSAALHLVKELQAASARHFHVQKKAPVPSVAFLLQKLIGAVVGGDLKACDLQDEGQGGAHRRIVVDDSDQIRRKVLSHGFRPRFRWCSS